MKLQSTPAPVNSIVSPAQSVYEAVKVLNKAAADQIGEKVRLTIPRGSEVNLLKGSKAARMQPKP